MSSDVDPTKLLWTRLEPVSRDPEMGEGLRAELGDPLWMLTRQWQLGEFKGEDAGTPVDIELDLAHDRLSAYQLHGGADANADPPAPVEYDGAPLEAVVEREAVVTDWKRPNARLAVQGGMRFVDLLEEEDPNGRSFDYADFPSGYHMDDVADGDAPVDDAGRRYADFVSGRTLDGHMVYRAIRRAEETGAWRGSALRFPWEADPDGPDEPTELPVPGGVVPTESWYGRAARAYTDWYGDVYDEPTEETGSAWDPERMEYRFRVATGAPGAGSDGSSTQTVLEGEGYSGGELGWYSFEETDGGSFPGAGNDNPAGPKATETRTEAVLPSNVSFGGMPKPRYWAFEDADVRLDEMNVDDAVDQALTNFALVYGNDWFSVPLDVPLGSLTRVRELEVTDTFGRTERVPPVGTEFEDSDKRETLRPRDEDWNAFMLRDIAGGDGLTPGLFLPPTVTDRTEADPVEKVALVRDETANMGFAVESRVEGPTGDPVERAEYQAPTLLVRSVSPAPDPAEESVVFRNPGDRPLDVQGWAVSDGDHANAAVFTDPNRTVVGPGRPITLHTGARASAEDPDETDFFWGRNDSVWHGTEASVLSVYDTDPASASDPLDHLRVRERIPGTQGGALPDTSYRLATDLPDHWFPLRKGQTITRVDTGRDVRSGSRTGDVMRIQYDYYFELALALDAGTLDAPDVAALPDPEGQIFVPYRDEGLTLRAEELTRTWKTITRSYQQSNWVDGNSYLWSGREVEPGTDDLGSSTLRFDVVRNWREDSE